MLKNEDIFQPGGLLDERVEQYVPREGQIAMADSVADAFTNGGICVVEAGTGTGKSYAYLAPAMSLLKEDPSARVIVATSTITLQKQLYDKDIPLLVDALGTDPGVSILYGRGNYVCIKRVEELKDEDSLELDDPHSDLSHVVEWMAETESGSIWDSLDWHVRRAWPDVMSVDRKCDGRRCPYWLDCFYFKARRMSQKARLIVTNHHLFLIDVKHRLETDADFEDDAILPAYTHAVLDEAHHLESEATEILSSRYSREALEKQLDYVTFRNKRQANMSILELLSPKAFSKVAVNEAVQIIRHVKDSAAKYEKAGWEMLERERDDEILFTPEAFQIYRPLVDMAGSLGDEMHDLAMRLGSMFDEERLEEEDLTNYENVLRTSSSLELMGDCLTEFASFAAFRERIPYIERNRRDKTLIMRICPMDVGPMLERVVYKNVKGMLFCSATLSVNKSFDFYKKSVGLDRIPTIDGIYPSPFDYRNNLMLLLPQDGAQYTQNDASGAYREYIINSAVEAISASGGGALVLFTNRRLMEACWEECAKRMPDMTIYCQGVDYGKNVLLKKFKEEKDSCLFATASFWEGIDAPGDTLRLVLIVKIPFQVPSQPIFRARSNSYGEGRGFAELSIPDAAIRLKQGIGRLIRNESDKGVVVILDSRMITKGYGMVLLHSLPDCFVPEGVTASSLARRIEDFLY